MTTPVGWDPLPGSGITLDDLSDVDTTGKADGEVLTYDSGTGNWVSEPAGSSSLPGAWTAYTPTWTASSTNPSIGNGSLAAAYVQFGKTVHFRINLTLGSTTSVGSGFWRFGLPVTAVADLVASHGILVTGYAENAGVLGYTIPCARIFSSSAFELLYHESSTDGAANLVASSSPFGWGDGDYLRMSGTYEAA